MNRDQLLTLATRLHNELHALRGIAHRLPVASMDRWKLSLRAEAIKKQLQQIQTQAKDTP